MIKRIEGKQADQKKVNMVKHGAKMLKAFNNLQVQGHYLSEFSWI